MFNISKAFIDNTFDVDDLRWCFNRNAEAAAKSARGTDITIASKYGASADQERSPLQQFDIQNITNPQGFGQQGVNKMLTAALGGAGGSSSSLIGEEQLAAKRGTTGPNSAVLDSIARQRLKAGAAASEGIAAQNETLKESQRENAANDLSRRYGIDVGAQLGARHQVGEDINTQIEAGKSGWFQNMTGFMTALGAMAGGAGKMMHPGGG